MLTGLLYISNKFHIFFIHKELNKKLIQLSKDTKIPKSKLLDEAIELLLQKRV